MSTNERGPSLVGSLGSLRRSKDFCSALTVLVGPAQNNVFLTVHYLNSFGPIPNRLGKQSCWVASLLVCVSGSATIS